MNWPTVIKVVILKKYSLTPEQTLNVQNSSIFAFSQFCAAENRTEYFIYSMQNNTSWAQVKKWPLDHLCDISS